MSVLLFLFHHDMVPRCFGEAVHDGQAQAFIIGAFSYDLVHRMFVEIEEAGKEVGGEAFFAVTAAPDEDRDVSIQFVCDFTTHEEAVGLVFPACEGKDFFFHFFPVSRVYGEGGRRCVVAVFHARRFGMGISFGQGAVYYGGSKGGEHFKGNAAGAVDDDLSLFDADDSGFHADAAGAIVDNGFDAAFHVMVYVLRRGRTGFCGKIGAGAGDGDAGGADEGSGGLVGRAADGNGVKAAGGGFWDDVFLWKYDGQRSRPEGIHQFFFQRCHFFHIAGHFFLIRHMNNEGVV